jgi:hypothetical protein
MWFLACAQAPLRPSLGLGAGIASTLFRAACSARALDHDPIESDRIMLQRQATLP